MANGDIVSIQFPITFDVYGDDDTAVAIALSAAVDPDDYTILAFKMINVTGTGGVAKFVCVVIARDIS